MNLVPRLIGLVAFGSGPRRRTPRESFHKGRFIRPCFLSCRWLLYLDGLLKNLHLPPRPRREVVLADLVQNSAVADGEQLRCPPAVPARVLQSAADRVNFRLSPQTAQREMRIVLNLLRLRLIHRDRLVNRYLDSSELAAIAVLIRLCFVFQLIHRTKPRNYFLCVWFVRGGKNIKLL